MVFTKEIFNRDNFNNELVLKVENRLENEQYTDTLKIALLYLTERIREITDLHDLDGDKLVTRAFNPTNPLIKVNKLESESDKNEQKGVMLILQGIYSAFRNPINHSIVDISEELCIKRLIFIDMMLEYVNTTIREQNQSQNILFDKVNKECLPYYLPREIDDYTESTLAFKNLWLFGNSGIGKTNIAIRYSLVQKRKFFHTIYFANVQSINDAFDFIYEELVDRLENEGKTFDCNTESINRKVKKVFKFLSDEYETVTIHFDEIYEFGESEFHQFFLFLLDILKNNSYDCCFSNLNIIVTTIVSPLEYLESLNRDSDNAKLKELFHFSEVEEWGEIELENLLNIINENLSVTIQLSDIVAEINSKPRELKNIIKSKMIGSV